ncbi:MAG: hypothetical protein EAZ07_07455 [Cytophagales bacterium]|nr:MAG: hypothetical protein EAZ07_07455 [Cytophagales bacterium]
MRNILFSFLLLFCLLIAPFSKAIEPLVYFTQKPNYSNYSVFAQKSKLEGFNIKLSPSLFWKTTTIEFEYPIAKHISLGVNVSAKLGRWDGKKVNRTMPNEDYLNNGFAVEFVGKYYFKHEAPEGLYVQANLAYNNFFYQDGTTRPFSFFTHWREQDGANSLPFRAPKPFQFGVGVGYQVILLPKHFIGNVMIGTLGNFNGENEFQFSIYLAPSLGYVF